MEKINEALTNKEIEIKNQELKKLMFQKQKFVKQYGNQAEKIMVGKAVSAATKQFNMENKTKLREAIKSVLTKEELSPEEADKAYSNFTPEDAAKVYVSKLLGLNHKGEYAAFIAGVNWCKSHHNRYK